MIVRGNRFDVFGRSNVVVFDARKAKVEADYKLAKEKCDDLAGNNKDVCVKEAKLMQTRGLADAKVDKAIAETATTSGDKVAEVRKDAAEDKREAEYKVAVEKCDALTGGAKDACVSAAKSQYDKR